MVDSGGDGVVEMVKMVEMVERVEMVEMVELVEISETVVMMTHDDEHDHDRHRARGRASGSGVSGLRSWHRGLRGYFKSSIRGP